MTVRIYQPSKSAMQSGRGQSGLGSGRGSGRGRSGDWVLEFSRTSMAHPDRLMGWQSSSDTTHTVRLRFSSREAAIGYAEERGLCYHVINRGVRRRRIRGYADNFGSGRRQAWTH